MNLPPLKLAFLAVSLVAMTLGFFFQGNYRGWRHATHGGIYSLKFPTIRTKQASSIEAFAVLTLCPNQTTLCHHETLVPIKELRPLTQCMASLKGGIYLQALSTGHDRVLVYKHGTNINASHYSALQLDDVVMSDIKRGRSTVWAVSPARHYKLFETFCGLLGPHDDLEDLFDMISFIAAYFPKKWDNDVGAAHSPPSVRATVPALSMDDTPMKSLALVTYLSSEVHDWYVEAIRMMNWKLKMVCDGVPIPVVVMYYHANADYLELLNQEGIIVEQVQDINTTYNRNGRFKGIWGKQRVWQLKFKRVIFFDPDELLLQCPLSLLKYPNWSHGRMAKAFSSGTMVLEPSNSTMQEVETLVKSSGETNDQTLTEMYFNERGYSLPETYSLWKRWRYLDKHVWSLWKHCAIWLHFTGEKPWDTGLSKEIFEGTISLVSLFFQEYSRFKEFNPMGPTFEIPYNHSVLAQAEIFDSNYCPIK